MLADLPGKFPLVHCVLSRMFKNSEYFPVASGRRPNGSGEHPEYVYTSLLNSLGQCYLQFKAFPYKVSGQIYDRCNGSSASS